MTTTLSSSERKILLETAREAIQRAAAGEKQAQIPLEAQPENLITDGASFVTLTLNGRLRGCIGVMEAFQPLIQDVQDHAVDAAMSDYRFRPVSREELPLINIEISYLTPLKALAYSNADELCRTLRIGVDGVLIKAGGRSATFLPQVWEQLPTPEEFLSHLCTKMGAARDLWRKQPMDVYTYEVEKFSEP